MNNKGVMLSLYDYTGNMARPWALDGYECYAVDIKHIDAERTEEVGDGKIHYVGADLTEWLPPREEYAFVAAFPPCTNLAVSGARWFTDKGLGGLAEGIELVEVAVDICEWADAPYMIENPVSTLSTYWRDPDYTFHPYEYDGFTAEDDAYSKKTCLWTGGGFEMPVTDAVEEYDDRIHKMAPSEDRAEKRAATPQGFANAVYVANVSTDRSQVGPVSVGATTSQSESASQNNSSAKNCEVE